MKNVRAFSLLEVLIALSLSSFILLGLTQAYQSVTKFFERSRERMVDNRKVCLLFNQLDRDISAAFIPQLLKVIEPKKGAQKDSDKTDESDEKQSTEDKKEQKNKELEKIKEFFLATESDDIELSFKYEDRRLKPFGRLTFITTNPLQVYGSSVAHIVRVAYELVKDKEHSDKEHTSYKLLRKESHDIENPDMKVSEFDYEKVAKQVVREQVLTDNIKSFHVEYISFKEEKKDDNADGKEEQEEAGKDKDAKKEELRSFTWGDKPEVQGVVPQRVEVTVVFWNKGFSGTHHFHLMIPIFSYPTEQQASLKKSLEKEEKEKQAQQEAQQADQAGPKQSNQAGQATSPAAPDSTPPPPAPSGGGS